MNISCQRLARIRLCFFLFIFFRFKKDPRIRLCFFLSSSSASKRTPSKLPVCLKRQQQQTITCQYFHRQALYGCSITTKIWAPQNTFLLGHSLPTKIRERLAHDVMQMHTSDTHTHTLPLFETHRYRLPPPPPPNKKRKKEKKRQQSWLFLKFRPFERWLTINCLKNCYQYLSFH